MSVSAIRRSVARRARRRIERTATETAVPVADGAVELVLVRLDAEVAATHELARCLSDAERLRASRFVFKRDCRRFIVGRARLRHLLASRLGTRAELVELDYGPRGKPRLAGGFAGSDLRFNVSHCGDVALYAFSRGREIGVDVEAVYELRDADAVAASFFSRRENEAYLALDPRDQPLGFFRCWTRKEAFIKALGDGLHFPLDTFDVSLAPGEPARILRVRDVAGSACGWTLHDVDLGLESRFAAAVVVARSRMTTTTETGVLRRVAVAAYVHRRAPGRVAGLLVRAAALAVRGPVRAVQPGVPGAPRPRKPAVEQRARVQRGGSSPRGSGNVR